MTLNKASLSFILRNSQGRFSCAGTQLCVCLFIQGPVEIVTETAPAHAAGPWAISVSTVKVLSFGNAK